jgi:hypothetical protein
VAVGYSTTSGQFSSEMSSSMYDTTSKPKRRSIKRLEKQQGFNFPNGLASLSADDLEREGPIGQLFESLKALVKMEHIDSDEFKEEALCLFRELGPDLWPTDRSGAWWLLEQNEIEEYPRNLYYHDEGDQQKYVPQVPLIPTPAYDDCRLWIFWLDMVEEKRINYTESERKKAERRKDTSRQGRRGLATSPSAEAEFVPSGRFGGRDLGEAADDLSHAFELQSDVCAHKS